MSAPVPGDANTLDLPPSHDDGTHAFAPAERAADAPALVPGYEILGELGRGGMGVVYKARHVALNRVVALKMILSGDHAGEAERQRFRTESQAIARLQHPNVVQVFEVGECEGRPFFSMEYCAGGSLEKRLAGTPLPPAEAAALVATLARAVQAAHEHGVIHRDLKPANVLLALLTPQPPLPQGERGSQKTPVAEATSPAPPSPLVGEGGRGGEGAKITDFGLAKQLDEQGQTLSGAIMGTPSYVAPEQAQGTKVGPAADTYSLGAILYECLTGRPPFRAATAMETLLQVTTQEPVPPRQLNPTLPRDLDTIALKCLHKDPARRYASAADLAADLTRWLAGEPILARPVSPLVRAAKWVRRRPALAGLAAVCTLAVLALLAVSVAFNVRLRQEKAVAVAERDEADRQRSEADRQRIAARENFRLARAAVDEYAKKAAEDPRLKELGVRELRKEWLQAAEKFYQQFVEQAGDDRDVRLDQARAFSRLAAISAEIGTGDDAERQYRRARATWQKLLDDFPNDVECRTELADVLAGLASLTQDRGQDRAEALHLEAHAAYVALADARPGDFTAQTRLASSHNRLGMFFKYTKPERAEQEFRRAIALAEEATPRNDDEREVVMLVAMGHFNLGGLYQNQQKYDKADAAFAAARETFETRAKRGGLSADHRKILALLHFGRATMAEKRGDVKTFGATLREALKLLDQLAKEVPHVLDVQNTLASTLMLLGLHCHNEGDVEGAAHHYARASTIQERLYLNHPGVKQYRTNRLEGMKALAMLYFSTGEAKPCEEKLDRAAEAARELIKAHPGDAELKYKLAETSALRQRLYRATGRANLALDEHRREWQILDELARESDNPAYRVALAACCCNLGNYVWNADRDEAYRLYDRGIAVCLALIEAGPDADAKAYEALAKNLNNRADYLIEKKRFDEALADRRLALDASRLALRLQRDDVGSYVQLAYTSRMTGETLVAMGRADEAEAHYLDEVQTYEMALDANLSGERAAAVRPMLAAAQVGLANYYAYEVRGRANDAIRPYRQAIHHYSRLAMLDPNVVTYLLKAGGESCNLAHLLGDQINGRPEALAWYGRAEWLLLRAREFSPDNLTARRYLRNVYDGQSRTLARLRRDAEAVGSHRLAIVEQRALAEASKGAQEWLTLAENQRRLGRQCERAGLPAEAEAAYVEAAGVCEKWLDDAKLGRAARAALARVCSDRAATYAGALARSASDARVPLAVREKRSETLARSALALLERARGLGHFAEADRVQELSERAEFASLRRRGDYRAWAAKLRE